MLARLRAGVGSLVYRRVRRLFIDRQYARQDAAGHVRDLEAAIDAGDAALLSLYRYLKAPLFSFATPPNIGVHLYDLHFPSPLVVSAFKSDVGLLNAWLDMGMGAAILKTILKAPRPGHPRPRIQELPALAQPALVNAMGLPGPGLDALQASLRGHGLFQRVQPIGFSIGGHTVDDYIANTEALVAYVRDEGLHNIFFEINISCPNQPDSEKITSSVDLLKRLLSAVRAKTDIVLGVKLSPDQPDEDLLAFASAVAELDRTYVNLGNTQYKAKAELDLPDQALSMPGGGLSGRPLLDRTLAMLRLIQPLGLPMMATGGITTPASAIAASQHGATLVGMATGLVTDPYAVPLINHAFMRYRKAQR